MNKNLDKLPSFRLGDCVTTNSGTYYIKSIIQTFDTVSKVLAFDCVLEVIEETNTESN